MNHEICGMVSGRIICNPGVPIQQEIAPGKIIYAGSPQRTGYQESGVKEAYMEFESDTMGVRYVLAEENNNGGKESKSA